MANGALEQAALPPLGEEERQQALANFDPSSVTGTEEIIEAVQPDPLAELRKMATMTKDDAMARLRESRATLAKRRTKQERGAEQDRWLALAQGMLSPTQTGAFGENVGMAAENLRGANAMTFKQEQAIAEEEERLLTREYAVAGDYFDSLANLEGFKSNTRARVVGLRDVISPADQIRIQKGEITEAEAERNFVSVIMQPDGTTVGRLERQQDGTPWIMVNPNKDPSQLAAQTTAKNVASLSVQNANKQANDGILMMPAILRLRRAHNLLVTLDENTSGLNEAIRTVAQWAGISDTAISDNTTLAALHRLFGDQVLVDLKVLTGNKTDFEYKKMEELNAGLKKSVPENLAILEQGMIKMNEIIERGEYAAQMLAESPGNEEAKHWQNQYVRFQKESAELMQLREIEQGPPAVPQATLDKFMLLMQEAQGNPTEQKRIMDLFRKRAEIPQELIVPLRELGAPL